MNVILIAVISLGAIALVSAAILYIASKKFAVYEDPRIAQVGEVLPQANCGGCGYPGCSGFADACVKAGSLDGKFCPVGGQPVMTQIAEILGLDATAAEPMVAVVRCNGTCANRPRVNMYDGAKSCAIAASLYGGETGCSFGCLADGVGEETYWDAGVEVAQLNFCLYCRITLQAAYGHHIHEVKTQFAQFGNLRLNEDSAFCRVQSACQIVKRHFDNILTYLFRVVHIVSQCLCIGNENEYLVIQTGVLQLHSSSQ